MALRLLLVRHAKSDQGVGGPDRDRPLNERGRHDAPRVGAWIAKGNFAPDEVLCSAARRTRETLDLMAAAWEPPPAVSFEERLYLAEPALMREVLSGATGSTVAMIGHNPGTGALMAELASAPPDHPRWGDVPTCAVALLEFEAEAWADIGRGRLLAFAVPADLEA